MISKYKAPRKTHISEIMCFGLFICLINKSTKQYCVYLNKSWSWSSPQMSICDLRDVNLGNLSKLSLGFVSSPS